MMMTGCLSGEVDSDGNMFTSEALASLAIQAKGMPITLGFDFGKSESIGVVTKASVKDGKLYIEGDVDMEALTKTEEGK